jgi:polysaccharide chain length determinant protein (PEP-CTERM system associated)
MATSSPGGFALADIKALIARRWVLFLVPFLAIALGTTAIVLSLPDVYRAETVVLVDQAKIPERYIAPISQLSGKDRLATLTDQIMSRTRLQQVVKELGLWTEDWEDPARMERRLGWVKRNIEVQVRGNDSFTIAFENEDPAFAQRMANQLAKVFIDLNARLQTERAEATTGFIDVQIQDLEQQIAHKEQEVKAFREANLGNLPEQKDTLFREVDTLEARLAANREAQLRLSERRASVSQQMAALRAQLQRPEEVSPLRAELLKAHQELQVLESQFTDRHPDVVIARRRVAEIQALLKSNRGGVELPPMPEAEILKNPLYTGLQRELEQIRLETASRGAERLTLERQLVDAKAKVAAVPRLDASWQALTRDVQTMRQNYDNLVSKKIQAGMAQQLEKEKAGQTFQVLDTAALPKTPVRPDRLKLILLGVVLGLGVGVGGAYLAETLDQTIRSVEQLKATYDLPVLGAVPDLAQDESKARRRARKSYLARAARAPQAARI